MRLAIVGTGAAGLAAARELRHRHEVTLFEAAGRPGGHINTVTVPGERGPLAIDTGFIVHNEGNYPLLTALLRDLGVPTQPTTMSFSFRSAASGLEYNPSSPARLFVQRRNLLSPRFYRMIAAILRFHREAAEAAALDLTLGEWLDLEEYPAVFVEEFLTPMGAALWSIPSDDVLRMPVGFFVRFFAQHGMLAVGGRPQWLVVQGGSGQYLDRMVAPLRERIRLNTPVGEVRRHADAVTVNGEAFDAVVLACHSDDALAMLADASPLEREILGALPYQESLVQLHTDPALLPRNRKAWGAWNYLRRPDGSGAPVVTYLMNALQSLPGETPWCVSLNAADLVAPSAVHYATRYRHPRHTVAGEVAQRRRSEISGRDRTYFCGAYWGFGFHEDAIRSGLDVARMIGGGG